MFSWIPWNRSLEISYVRRGDKNSNASVVNALFSCKGCAKSRYFYYFKHLSVSQAHLFPNSSLKVTSLNVLGSSNFGPSFNIVDFVINIVLMEEVFEIMI